MARLELESGTDVLLLESGDALLLESGFIVGAGAIAISAGIGRKISVSPGAGAVAMAAIIGRKIALAVGSHAPLTLRPNGVGASSENTPDGDTPNWKCVDEAVSDDNTTVVYTNSLDPTTDSYPLSAPSGSGIINSVTAYALCRSGTSGSLQIYVSINGYSNGDVEWQGATGDYALYHFTDTVSPETGSRWTWEELADLDVYLVQKSWDGDAVICTQVYVEVHYGSIGIAGTLGWKIAVALGAGAVSLAGALGRNIALSVGSGAVTTASSLGRKIKLAVGGGAVAMAGWGRSWRDRILSIFKSKSQDLTITSTLEGDMLAEGVYKIGSSVICSIVVKDAAGAGQDPVTSMKIKIKDSKGKVHVDDVAMTPDTGDGVYHYDFQTVGLLSGKYKINYTATDSTRISIEEDDCILAS